MLREVFPKALSGEISAPPSKSYVHRVLLLSAFRGEKINVLNCGDSEDVKATINAVKALGTTVKYENGNVSILGYDDSKAKNEMVTADIGESGSTFRFVIPLIGVLQKKVHLVCHGRLKDRPHDVFFKELTRHGMDIKSVSDGYEVTGCLESGTYNIDPSISSQYVSGLLLSLPYLQKECRVVLDGMAVSKSYIDITENVMKRMSVNFTHDKNEYIINGFNSSCPKEICIEGDWSGSSFFIVAGALSEKGIKISNLNVASVQGDAKIIDVIKQFGADVSVDKDSVLIKKGKTLSSVSINLNEMIDSVPILAVLASFAHGVSEFSGIERLRFKESDRIEAARNMLENAGIKTEYKNDKLYIYGGEPHSGEFNGENDHRIVMSASVLASFTRDGKASFVSTPNAVKKSYPTFYEDFEKLGGISRVKMERE